MIKTLLFSGAVGLLLLLWAFVVEPRLLKICRYRLSAPELAGIKAVFASDFHFAPDDGRRLQKIVDAINAEKPDIVFLGGDFVKGHRENTSMSPEDIAAGLAEISAPCGVYAVWGNHDAWQKHEKITAALQNVGIVVLANSNRRVECRNKVFYIAGVEDMTTGRPNVERALQGVKPPVVLLSHSPDVFPLVPDTVVLTLAGHTHGGQVRLPFVGAPIANSRYGQKYLYGLKEENGHRLIVTAGLGTSLLPMRFGSVPEIVVIGWQ